mgnify:CR=1 FL=1
MALDDFYILKSIAFTKPHRSRKFLDKVKSLPCIRCDGPADDPHHIFGSMMSLKSSDLMVVPVCRPCHDWYEAHPLSKQELIMPWIVKVVLPILKEI